MKLKIHFPIFDGFYNSVFDDIFEISEDLENYGDVSQSQYDSLNWSKINNEIAKDYINTSFDYYKNELLSFGIKSLTFVDVKSPKEYNFTTDKINCNIVFNVHTFKKNVLDFINNNKNDFNEFIKDNYSSYSGFISFYSNDPEHWLNIYIKDLTKDMNIFEGFFEFILLYSVQFDKEYIHNEILNEKHQYIIFE